MKKIYPHLYQKQCSVYIRALLFPLEVSRKFFIYAALIIAEISAPPYEVTEMVCNLYFGCSCICIDQFGKGWGEFEAGIRIFFKDTEEKVFVIFAIQ